MIRHPVPNEHLQGIGDITVSFTLLELSLQMFVWSLKNDSQKNRRKVTAQLTFNKLRTHLIKEYKNIHGNNLNLENLMDRADKLAKIRNQIIHSVWGPLIQEKKSIPMINNTLKKGEDNFDFKYISCKDLEKIASDIRKLEFDIIHFQSKLLEQGQLFNNPL